MKKSRSIESREPDTAICLPSSTSRQRTVKVWPRSTCLPLPDASRKHARSGCSHRSRRSRLCCQIEHAAAPLVYARRIARELRLGELSRLPASGSVLRLADYICGLAKDSPLRSTSSALGGNIVSAVAYDCISAPPSASATALVFSRSDRVRVEERSSRQTKEGPKRGCGRQRQSCLHWTRRRVVAHFAGQTMQPETRWNHLLRSRPRRVSHPAVVLMDAEQDNIGSRLVRLAAAAVLGTVNGHLVLAIVCCEDVIGGGALSAFARTADESEAPHAGVVAEQGVGVQHR